MEFASKLKELVTISDVEFFYQYFENTTVEELSAFQKEFPEFLSEIE